MDWTTRILSDQEFREAMTAELIEAIHECRGHSRFVSLCLLVFLVRSNKCERCFALHGVARLGLVR